MRKINEILAAGFRRPLNQLRPPWVDQALRWGWLRDDYGWVTHTGKRISDADVREIYRRWIKSKI